MPQLTAAGGTNSLVAIDAASEIEVKTFPSATEGRTSGGTFNVTTKSGTNAHHGSLFETFGNETLNAADPFANARGFDRAPSRLNLFGGTLGGPLVKDKAFFFGNYEVMRLRQGAFATTEVPTIASRLAAGTDLRALFSAFPLPNGPLTSNGLAEFSSVFANPASHDIFGLKTDINFTDKFSLTARYNFANSKASWRGDRLSSLSTLRQFDTTENSLSLQANYVLSPNMIANVRSAFSRNTSETSYGLDNFGGAMPVAAPLTGLFRYDIGGRAGFRSSDKTRSVVNEFQTNGTFKWIAGNHDITFGGDIRRLAIDLRPFSLERNVLFGSLSPAGTAARINELNRTAPGTRSTENFSVFGQDIWRMDRRFSLTGGLRWDMDLNPDMNDVTTLFQNASTRIPNRFGNFAPRLSAAYDITGNGKAVFRAGAGMYYDFGNLNSTESYVNSYPYVSGASARNVPFNTVPVTALNPLTLFATDLKTPHTWQIFTEYQQQFFRDYTISASFVATYGRDLLRAQTFTGADPVFNIIRFTDNSGSSNYHALNIRTDRRFTNNFSYNARYTWSRSTDNVSAGTITNSQFVSGGALDKSASDFDARHTLSILGIYELPKLARPDSAKWWARDWTVSANLNARSANPVNVTYAQVNDLGVQYYRPDAVAGVSPYLTTGELREINPAAFFVPPVLTQGTLARNAFRGFPLFQINTALEKRFKLGSETSLQIKAEALNILNTVNYENMSGSMGTRFQDGTFLPNYYFGKTMGTLGSDGFTPFYLYGGARTVQLSAKFVF
jgi:hypothetical protein